MSALFFCLGAWLFGIEIVRRAFRDVLNETEQTLSGMIVGWMIVVWCAYALARVMDQISYAAILSLTIAVWLAVVYLWWPQLVHLRQTLRRTPSPTSLPPEPSFRALFGVWQTENRLLLLLLILCAPLYYYFFSMRMLEPRADGLYSGANSWNDMAWHIAISSSFLYGQNFPPAYTPLYAANAVEPLRYPFLPDFHTAVLMRLGLSSWSALMLTAVPLALSITGLFYCLARRITNSATTSLLATTLFLLNGGLGFLYFFEDWRNSKEGFFAFLSHLEHNYANMWDKQIHWANIVVDSFLPHRTSLYGIPLTLIIFIVFAVLWQRWNEDESAEEATKKPTGKTQNDNEKNAWKDWRVLFAAGVLTGLLPLFHSHSYIALGLVSGFLFLLRPRRVWLAFWLPAVALAVPQLTGAPSALASRHFLYLQLNWKGNTEASWLLYWLRNLGLPLLLIVPAWLAAPRVWRTFYVAFALLMLFCCVVMVSPHDYDNIKIMYYCYGLSCILIASWLMTLASRYKQRFVAALLVVLSIMSGALALQRERLIHWRMFSTEEMAAAAFVRDHAAPHALFLTAPIHNQPILCLAGRPILMGYGGWLWTHGYEFAERERDAKAVFAGAPNALTLLDKYGVDYIYVSATEQRDQKANMIFLRQNFPVVYGSGDIAIYDARKRLATTTTTVPR